MGNHKPVVCTILKKRIVHLDAEESFIRELTQD